MNWNTLKQLNRYSWWVWALWIWALAVGLGQLQRWQVTPNIALYLHEVIMFVLVLVWGWKDRERFFKLISDVPKKRVSVSVLLLLVIAVVSQVVGMWLSASAWSLMFLGRWCLYAVWWWLALPRLTTLGELQPWWAILPALLTAWFGWWQYLFLPDLRWLYVLGWDNHYWRLVSTQLDPGYAGIILVLGWITLQHDWWRRELKWMYPWFVWPGWAAAALTMSRATWLAAGLSLLLLAWRQPQRWRFWTASALVFVSCIWLAPKPGGEGVNLTRTSTVTARWQTTKDYTTQLKPWNLVLGHGWYTHSNNQEVSWWADHSHLPDAWPIALVHSWGVMGSGLAGFVAWRLWQQQRVGYELAVIQVAALLLFGLFNNIWQPFVVLGFLTLSHSTLRRGLKS